MSNIFQHFMSFPQKIKENICLVEFIVKNMDVRIHIVKNIDNVETKNFKNAFSGGITLLVWKPGSHLKIVTYFDLHQITYIIVIYK